MRDVTRFTGSLPAWLLLVACANGSPAGASTEPPVPRPFSITTDKAAYAPGEPVVFSLSGNTPAGARVRYLDGDSVIAESPVGNSSWTWQPPSTDFHGYLAEIYSTVAGRDSVAATVGIDVSSDWTRFPRYGFLSNFGALSSAQMDAVVDDLNRHHINGLQFYDWHHAHHEMVPRTTGALPPVWTNISNTEIHLATVSGYIAAAHQRNMRAMFYNLIYGALENAAADGVSDQWYLYTDPAHTMKDKVSLPQPPFVSDIYVMDPGNPGWQHYLAQDADRVYQALDFDGFHMDQMGERPTRYTAAGRPVELASTFESFITAMHAARPDKYAVMNAVNQYGQAGIARAPTAFLYSEVWSPHESYGDLAGVILQNDTLSGGRKPSVLTAYVNYDLAEHPGVFNTPSVLFADAVIFAFGGAHLELGEHMLGKEYFPNGNLAMKTDLRRALVPYYDFLVAYETLLRGGGTFDTPELATPPGGVPLAPWPAQQGRVAVVGKRMGNREVVHLLNFTDATTMRWRDNAGIQAYPRARTQIPLRLATSRSVARVWYATPDRNLGAPQTLRFTETSTGVSFTLPSLDYWSMIVIEYR